MGRRFFHSRPGQRGMPAQQQEKVLAKICRWWQLGYRKPQTQEAAAELEPESVVEAEASAEPPSRSAEGNVPQTGEPLEFDEEWYLGRYPDVAAAVQEGRGQSGLQHYLAYGRREGRMPVPPPRMASAVSGGDPSGATERQPDAMNECRPVMDASLTEAFAKNNGGFYLTPHELFVSDVSFRRVAVIGSCLTEQWGLHKGNAVNCPVDLITVNNLSKLPVQPAEKIREYDFQVIQLPLRGVLPDHVLWHISYSDVDSHERAFQESCNRMEVQLNCWMDWNVNHGLLTFVSNFFLPQQNLMGRLFPRFDIRNPEYFVEKLNEHLEMLVRRHKNAYILDVDRISASLGRRYIQDDSVLFTSHGALMQTPGRITDRIEPLAPMLSHYRIKWHPDFQQALWNELLSMYRTIRQKDSTKLVVVDLDDTLWGGISGDMTEIGPAMVDGWHIGLVEALLYLKKRGVLLAIISKNDEDRILYYLAAGIW